MRAVYTVHGVAVGADATGFGLTNSLTVEFVIRLLFGPGSFGTAGM